ncbi:MAG: 30S ribosomal protein S17 [Planctomycetes bacterium]|nr:30S ribosomal protein S17 [Planctomycetota bacterium]
MVKTITVKVERFVQHPTFGKYVRRFTTCYAHDEKREAKRGDRVEIMEMRPLSRLKRWRLVKVVGQGSERDLIRASRPTTGK